MVSFCLIFKISHSHNDKVNTVLYLYTFILRHHFEHKNLACIEVFKAESVTMRSFQGQIPDISMSNNNDDKGSARA